MVLKSIVLRWKQRPENGDKLGLIAQDLLKEVPEVVRTFDYQPNEEDETLVREELDRLGVYYSDLIPVLIKGMQEQQALIEELQKNAADQQAEVQRLTKEIKELKADRSFE